MATSSMTLSLMEMHRHLPRKDQKPLPPAELTENLSQKTGIRSALSSELQQEATLVWGASYYGVIPGMDAGPSGPQMSAPRKSMMLLAHFVWGVSLSYAEEQLRQRGPKMLDGKRQSPIF